MPPLKYTADELKEEVNNYFENKKKEYEDKELVYMSISDICSYLDITSQTWRNYKKKPSYFGIIKKAEEKIKAEWIKNLFFPGRNSTGAMFWLKNQAGWADKVEHQHSGQIEHNHKPKLDKLSDEQLAALRQALPSNDEDQETIDVTPDPDTSND